MKLVLNVPKFKFATTIMLLLGMSFCKAQINTEKFTFINDSIIVEKFDNNVAGEDKYNLDNKIYKANKLYTYSYYYVGLNGERDT